MPEEQAFGVLVKVMHRWALRDMYKENFEQLQLRLYQLDRLIETMMPELWQHFVANGLESHMYASQWFLTIFTAKFPLFLVFRVIDCFLLFGFDSIFQVKNNSMILIIKVLHVFAKVLQSYFSYFIYFSCFKSARPKNKISLNKFYMGPSWSLISKNSFLANFN